MVWIRITYSLRIGDLHQRVTIINKWLRLWNSHVYAKKKTNVDFQFELRNKVQPPVLKSSVLVIISASLTSTLFVTL